MHDACHRIIDAYGPDRCLWGSAFPCELWCPQDDLRPADPRSSATAWAWTPRARDAILGQTAHRLYFERKTDPPTTTKGTR